MCSPLFNCEAFLNYHGSFITGLISVMPDTSGYEVTGTSSRSSLDDTVMDIDPPEDSDGKAEIKQVSYTTLIELILRNNRLLGNEDNLYCIY